MKTLLKLLIIVVAIALFVDINWVPLKQVAERVQDHFAPCGRPVGYEIGTFDTKFGISEAVFLKALADAEAIWEKPVGKDLFAYKEGGDVKVNLIYDYRQEATGKLRTLGIEVNDTKSSYNTLKAKFDAMKAAYTRDTVSFNSRVAILEVRNKKYQDEVSSWNRQGGAPKPVYDRLQKEKAYLDAEARAIELQQATLNRRVDDINAMVVVLNRLVNSLNINVARFNEIGESVGEEFDEGVYRSSGAGEEIDIYQFDTSAKLVRVLAHELGHALGLDHVDDPKAIMYRLNQSSNEKLTADDLAAVRTVCGMKE